MMLDLALDAKKHDLIIKDGDFIHIDNAERVAQQIKVQLLTWYGEWFLDITHGVPYLEYILVKNPNFTLIRQVLIEQIQKVTDVDSVDSLEIEYDSKKREIKIDFACTTKYGVITRKEVLGYGLRGNT